MSIVPTLRVHKQSQETAPSYNVTEVSSRFLEKKASFQKQTKKNSLIVNGLLFILTVFLMFQFIRGTVINIERYMVLNSKMTDLKILNASAVYENNVLKKKFKSYNSPEGLEGLARDYLNLVGENEISVILKKT